MYIQLTTIDQAEQRNFYLHVDELELVFELIHNVTQSGERVASINYVDQKGELFLPIEAIYLPFLVNPIRQLKQQWESILDPLNVTELNNIKLMIRQNERLTTLRRKQLYDVQQLQQQMLQLLETTQSNLTDGPRKKRLLALHQHTIQRCQQSINKIEALSESASH